MSDEELIQALGEDRSAFREEGAKAFGPEALAEAKQQASSIPSALRSGAQSVAQGLAMAPAEIASGAVRLASPELADKIDSGIGKFNTAMRENSNYLFSGLTDKNDGISPEAANNLYQIGNTLPLGLGSGGVASALGAGALGGLQASGEGDSRTQTLTKAGAGAAIGGVLQGASSLVPKTIGKIKDVAMEKLGLDDIAAKKANEQAIQKADELHRAFKSEVNGVYKDLGLGKPNLSSEEYQAQADFLKQFKYNVGTGASAKFDAALATPAPQSVQAFVKELPVQVTSKAVQTMKKSGDILDVKALQNPDSSLFYEQLRKSIAGTKTPGNQGLSKDMVTMFQKDIPGYKEAMSEYMSSKTLNSKLSENFFNTIKSNKYEQLSPQIDKVLSTKDGQEVLNSLFISGMKKDLIRNSNLTPLEQLTTSIGKDPLQQSQVVNYLTKIGKQESADKIEALASFVNATKMAKSQPNSAASRMVGMKSSELDPTKMSEAISNLMNSKTRFSKEFTKIMQEQVPTDTRTEKLFNLLKRAGKSTSTITSTAVGRTLLDAENTDRGY